VSHSQNRKTITAYICVHVYNTQHGFGTFKKQFDFQSIRLKFLFSRQKKSKNYENDFLLFWRAIGQPSGHSEATEAISWFGFDDTKNQPTIWSETILGVRMSLFFNGRSTNVGDWSWSTSWQIWPFVQDLQRLSKMCQNAFWRGFESIFS